MCSSDLFMSFSGIIVRAIAKRAGTVSASAEGVSVSAGAVCSLTGVVIGIFG